MSNTNKISLPKNIAKKEYDAYLTLLDLIDFLKKYDKKFEEFITISSISLTNPIYDEERSYILFSISDCIKLPIDKLPNIYEYRQMLINKGADPKKFDVKLVSKLLQAYVLQGGYTNRMIAYKILNHSDNNKF